MALPADHLAGGHRPTLAHLAHLVGRFIDVATAAPLSPSEEAEVAGLLKPGESQLFWAQAVADQRHALAVCRAALRRRPGRRDLARAALLHDVGKRHAPLGAVARSAATVLALLHRPAPGRLAVYLEHARLGGDDLEVAGAEPLVVEFARHHTGSRPASIDPEVWEVLRLADEHPESRSRRANPPYDGARREVER